MEGVLLGFHRNKKMKKNYKSLYDPIQISEKLIKKCDFFGQKMSVKHSARKRNQDPEKIKRDHALGKKGECIVYLALKREIKEGQKLSKPDFAIYSAKEKSWDADLFLKTNNKNKKIHVKTQEFFQSKKFGLSWIFQYNNKEGFRGRDVEIFDAKNGSGFIFMVSFNEETNIGKICAICQVKTLLEKKMFKPPLKSSLNGIKKCIYAKDLIKEKIVKKENCKMVKGLFQNI